MRRRAPSGDSARRMALLRRRRSLWLLLCTMVTFTAIPYKSTTPYTTGGVSGVATPAAGRRGDHHQRQPPRALAQRPALGAPLPWSMPLMKKCRAELDFLVRPMWSPS